MSADPPTFDARFQAELRLLFEWRRDVRRFRRDAVEDEIVQSLLETAALAPSVGLSQPWRFVTVDDPGRREAVRDSFVRCNADALAAQPDGRAGRYARLKLAGLDEAPRHLAVFVEPEPVQGHALGRRTMPETVAYSAVIAVHTLWLAARAAGLGVGWVSILEPEEIARALEVPAAWRFVAYLCVGFPEEESVSPALEQAGWEWRRRCAVPALRR